MVRGELEHLLKVRESGFHVILVVETETAHVDSVCTHLVLPQEVVGQRLRLGVSTQEGQALGSTELQVAAGSSNLERPVKAVERLTDRTRVGKLISVRNHLAVHVQYRGHSYFSVFLCVVGPFGITLQPL